MTALYCTFVKTFHLLHVSEKLWSYQNIIRHLIGLGSEVENQLVEALKELKAYKNLNLTDDQLKVLTKVKKNF